MNILSRTLALFAIFFIPWAFCACPPGFKEVNSKCYYFSNFAASQESAQQVCQSKSSKLFEPTSNQVLDSVKSEAGSSNTWWLGLQREKPTESFKYMSSGESANQAVVESFDQAEAENHFICEAGNVGGEEPPNHSTSSTTTSTATSTSTTTPSSLARLFPFTFLVSTTSTSTITSTISTTTSSTSTSTTFGSIPPSLTGSTSTSTTSTTSTSNTEDDPTTTQTTTTTTTTPAPPGKCPFYDGKCSCDSNSCTCIPKVSPVPDPTEVATCILEVGPVRNRRIVGGNDATKGEYPFMASIEQCFDTELEVGGGKKRDVMLRTHFCGGTVISKKHILTAAHCLNDKTKPNMIAVVLGGHKFKHTHTGVLPNGKKQKKGCVEGSPIFFAKKTLWHPQFKPSVDNDFGIIILLKDIPNAQPIFFPPNAQANYIGKDVTLTGWGHTKATADGEAAKDVNIEPPGALQEVTVKVLPDATCTAKYKQGYTANMMCEGHQPGGKGHCFGDSGGPVIYTDNQKMILVGVQSSSAACGAANIPNISAKITAGMAWIEQVCSGIKKAT